MNMKLRNAWPRKYTSCCGRPVMPDTIRAEADCRCGLAERHQHCAACGYLAVVGDWDAPPIAEWTLSL